MTNDDHPAAVRTPDPRAKSQRSDAQRNRARVLSAAVDAFAEAGLAVPVHEIARRAGVGTGTVSRHFPTKDDLYDAIVLDRVERLVSRGLELARDPEPGRAFFEFFALWVREGAVNRGLAQALAGVGFDMEAAALRAGLDINGTLEILLKAAQQAGTVRADAAIVDVKALLLGCCMTRYHKNSDERERIIRIAGDGLRPR
ncbi:MAG TPA: helix-turn-helix domain-containing protein [Actinocrinis sp.]|jgi:AcrR family transcriptional regulator